MSPDMHHHRNRPAQRTQQRGFTYLTLLFLLPVLTGGFALLGEVWHTAAVRDKERELLFVGHQYRLAIERYYLAGTQSYPRTLDDLLKDPRRLTTERYLRKRYLDPVTGKPEWGLVKAADGGIMGVYSLSESRPLKSANFRLRDQDFLESKTYSGWKFIYTPAPLTPGRPAGVSPIGSTTPGSVP